MASEVKANKLSPSSGTDLTLGDTSDTVIVPTGVTLNIVDGLGVAKGGTGLTSFTAGDVLYATGSTTLAKLGKGTGLQGLQTNSGATAPEWANSPQSLMTAAGDILYASGANTLAKLAKGSDDDVLTLASGVPSWAAAAGGGKIGQVLQAVKTDTSTYGTEAFADIPDMTVDITPVATSSKILVMTDASVSITTGLGLHIRLMRDTTAIYIGDAASPRQQASKGRVCDYNAGAFSYSFQYLDSPNTTSATTYKLQWWPEIDPAFIGRTTSDTSGDYISRTANSITVMEVLA